MAIKLSTFAVLNDITVLVHFPGNLSKMKNSIYSGYVLDKVFTDVITVREYWHSINSYDKLKIEQVLHLLLLDREILDVPLNCLSKVETMKVQFGAVLFWQSKVIILDHFFTYLTYKEQQYFKRFVRNLASKQQKSLLIVEDDMDFLGDFVHKFVLFTKKEKYRYITDFYDLEIYQYVKMPKTVELVLYLEKMGHKIDHEVTFNETLKAIYRGVA